MKRITSFFLLIILIVIILPLFIVKSCNFRKDDGLTIKDGVKIKVFMTAENIIKEVLLEDYLKNVLAAEMPASFEIEALKAQAVAARTYAFARMMKLYMPKESTHPEADVCTDPAHCQAWVSKEAVMKKWGFFSAYKNWNKIERAVHETETIIMTYDNTVINAVFHANSGGKTENAKDVWTGNEVPYLRSVTSEGEDAASDYSTTTSVVIKEFIEKIKGEYPGFKINEKDVLQEIKIMDYTEGERVKTLRIGNVILKGTDVRRILSLRSANFKIEKGEAGTLKITTQGYGHGVGMSQWGANYLAKGGGNFEEILKHYYTGVELTSIEDYIRRQ